MSAVNLELSIERLKECYVGKDKEGNHVLDKSKINELSFLFAFNRVAQAIENEELTDKQLIRKISKKEAKK